MILAFCIDDRGGISFHGRRLSMDRALRADLLTEAGGRPLWMSPYSAAQFAPDAPILVSDTFLEQAGEGVLCFVEARPIAPWLARAEGLVVYRWNRVYPFDLALDISPEEAGFSLLRRTDFPGYSHPKLTKEVYQR